VTNGPFLDFRVADARPGGVVAAGSVDWSLDLATATSVDTVEIIVNGRVVASRSGLGSPGGRSYAGQVNLPAGGWVAARAREGETRWPSMDVAPYAHTAPVWIEERGSTDAAVRREAATELGRLLEAAIARLRMGYSGVAIPRLESHFAAAMARLEAMATGESQDRQAGTGNGLTSF